MKIRYLGYPGPIREYLVGWAQVALIVAVLFVAVPIILQFLLPDDGEGIAGYVSFGGLFAIIALACWKVFEARWIVWKALRERDRYRSSQSS